MKFCLHSVTAAISTDMKNEFTAAAAIARSQRVVPAASVPTATETHFEGRAHSEEGKKDAEEDKVLRERAEGAERMLRDHRNRVLRSLVRLRDAILCVQR